MNSSKFFLILLIVIIIFSSFSYSSKRSEEKYDKGFEDGYDSGKSDGYNSGYEEGYTQGVDDCDANMADEMEAREDEVCTYEEISYCVVFVTTDGKYHHFTCKTLGEDFWDNYTETAYDIPHAKSLGYSPCEICYKN